MFKEDNSQIPELKLGINLLRNEQRFYRLPLLRENNYFVEDGDTVELVLLDTNQFSIESYERPMRYGKYYNNRVFFNTMIDQFNVNPKFVFDSVKQVWTLLNVGYLCFAEMELEFKSNHKRCDGKDA